MKKEASVEKNLKKISKKRSGAGFSLALAAVTLAVTLTGCGQEEVEEVDLTISVESAKPQTGDLTLQNEFIGSISPQETVYVYPKAQGEVTSVNFAVGDYVNVGDVLFTIDSEAAQMTLDAAKAGQATAKVSIDSTALQTQIAIDNANIAKVQKVLGDEATAEQNQININSGKINVNQAKIGLSQLEDSRSNIKGQINKLEDQIDALEKKQEDLDRSTTAGETLYQTYDVQLGTLRSSLDSLEKSKDSLDDQITSAAMSIQIAENQLKSIEEGIEATNDQSVVTMDQLDRAIANATQSKAIADTQAQLGAQSAAIQVEQAEYALSNYTVTAPISGYITAKTVELHNMATSQAAAYTITNQDSMTVTFNVSEDIMRTLSVGQKLTVERNGTEYTATITEIADSVGVSTGLFQIKGTITENASSLSNGVSVKIFADTYSTKNALLIPYGAVYYEDGRPYVYLARDGKAAKTYIETGIFNDTEIVVTGGLTKEDDVITSWSPQLTDGADVRIVQLDTAETEQETKPE